MRIVTQSLHRSHHRVRRPSARDGRERLLDVYVLLLLVQQRASIVEDEGAGAYGGQPPPLGTVITLSDVVEVQRHGQGLG